MAFSLLTNISQLCEKENLWLFLVPTAEKRKHNGAESNDVSVMKSALKYCILPGAEAQRERSMSRKETTEIISQSESEPSHDFSEALADSDGLELQQEDSIENESFEGENESFEGESVEDESIEDEVIFRVADNGHETTDEAEEATDVDEQTTDVEEAEKDESDPNSQHQEPQESEAVFGMSLRRLGSLSDANLSINIVSGMRLIVWNERYVGDAMKGAQTSLGNMMQNSILKFSNLDISSPRRPNATNQDLFSFWPIVLSPPYVYKA